MNALLSLLQFLQKLIRPVRRAPEEMRIPPEQLRKALADLLADPETRRLVFPYLAPLFPVQGSSCPYVADDVGPGSFGANCSGGDYSFPGKLGVGTTPAAKLDVQGTAGSTLLNVRDGSANAFTVDGWAGATTYRKLAIAPAAYWASAADVSLQVGSLSSQTGNVLEVNSPGTSGGTFLVVKPGGGNVGVGTTDRLSRLTVKARASFSASGTVSVANGSATVTGSSTSFTKEVGLGDRITVSSQTRTVVNIASDSSLTVDSAFTTTASGQTMTVLPSIFRADDSSGNPKLIVTDDGRTLLNRIVFLQPLGGSLDDQPQIQAAINNLPANGGIIMLMPGYDGSGNPIPFRIGSQITISKNGVKLRGYGGVRPDDNYSPYSNPTTLLLWQGGSYADAVVKMYSPRNDTFIKDLELSDLTIDGNDETGSGGAGASIGLFLDRVADSRFVSLHVRNISNSPGIGIKLTTACTIDNQQNDSAWNTFQDCTVFRAYQCVVLDRESGSNPGNNASHNHFANTALSYRGTSGSAGIYLGDCDNNAFYDTWIFNEGGSTGAGFGVVVSDPTKARSNCFYHVQAGCGSSTGSATSGSFVVQNAVRLPDSHDQNMVVGYDYENNQIPPSAYNGTTPVSVSGFLNWTDSKGSVNGLVVSAATGFQINGSADPGRVLKGNTAGTAYVDGAVDWSELTGKPNVAVRDADNTFSGNNTFNNSITASGGVNASSLAIGGVTQNLLNHQPGARKTSAGTVQLDFHTGSLSVTVTGLSSIDMVQVTLVSGASPGEYLGVGTPSGNQFTVFSSNTSSNAYVYWFVIGR